MFSVAMRVPRKACPKKSWQSKVSNVLAGQWEHLGPKISHTGEKGGLAGGEAQKMKLKVAFS